MSLMIFDYQESPISFKHQNGFVMVNATEMAKAFNKKVSHFLDLKSTKRFIQILEKNLLAKTENHGIYENLTGLDTDITASKNGLSIKVGTGTAHTWMHKILAIKFGAWLNPEFELWIYETIDRLFLTPDEETGMNFSVYHSRKRELKQL